MTKQPSLRHLRLFWKDNLNIKHIIRDDTTLGSAFIVIEKTLKAHGYDTKYEDTPFRGKEIID